MTITISNGQPGTQNVIVLMKSFVDKAFTENAIIDGTHCSTTHNLSRESVASLMRKAKDAGLSVKLWKDFT